MKKITLIHSYSDYNKGDLGIIMGSIYSLKKVDKNIIINAVSSFNYDDNFYKSHHKRLEKKINSIYPAIIGRLFGRNKIVMSLKLIIDTFKIVIIYFAPIHFVKIILNNEEKKTFDLLQNSDIVISKGGSFICNRDNTRDKIRLFREMTIIVLSIRLNKKTIIWGQSIGPVYGLISIKLVNWIMGKVNKVIVREDKCIETYTNLKFPENTIHGYDLAFSLKPKTRKLVHNQKTVGFTIKRFSDKRKDNIYTKVMINLITYITKGLKYNVLIIPHVTIDDDLIKSEEIVGQLDSNIKSKVTIDYSDYSISELFEIYSGLDLLIGTRLHSTIFALCTNTKVINIGYHGTKSAGIFDKFNISKYQIDIEIVSLDEIKKLIIEVLKNSFKFDRSLARAQEKNIAIAKLILS